MVVIAPTLLVQMAYEIVREICFAILKLLRGHTNRIVLFQLYFGGQEELFEKTYDVGSRIFIAAR